jgi:transcriptional regulator with XRE-family HTH domain
MGIDKKSNILDKRSMIKDEPSINAVLASRVRELRSARALSLAALAERSGVSRSMLSLIERGESSATAVVLERVAFGLGVSLASLFETTRQVSSPVARAADQQAWRDPQSGYTRRNVSPPEVSPIQIVEVSFPAQARVTYETGARAQIVYQQIWLLEGLIEVTLDETAYRLEAGDCLAMRLDQPVMYFNPGRRAARYAVVITTDR